MLNKDKKVHPVKEMLSFALAIADKKPPAQIKLKNFKIEKELCEDFELLCIRLKRSDFTTCVTAFIRDEVDANCEEIERLKKRIASGEIP
ncbi:MAG: hypothetical protein LBS99_07075 [Clostridiales bacterium]|jgi:hypothetical protein|nr:hypothetical protein [Clostridiales bacterium]